MINTDHAKIAKKLHKKGWEKEYIEHTVHMMQRAHEKKPEHIIFMDKLLFWMVLVLALVGNVILLIGFVPILIDMSLPGQLFFVAVLGLSFGLFIDIVLREIMLTPGHYLLVGVLSSIAAAATFFGVLQLFGNVLKYEGIFIKTQPLLVILVYIVAFSLPHAFFKVKARGSD